MGDYLLCERKNSDKPYFVSSVYLNIWSLEELCWFLSVNPALAAEIVFDPAFSAWLSDELLSDELIREFNAISSEDGHVRERLMWIFEKSYYFSNRDLRELRVRLETLDEMSPAGLKKQKGDTLLKYGKYKGSIECYRRALSAERAPNEEERFTACVWHNMGLSYEKMFLSGKALECFAKAYEICRKKEFLLSYLKAAYFDGGFEKLEIEAKRKKADAAEVAALTEEIDGITPKSAPCDMDAALRQWIRAYHLSVDQ